MRNFLTETFDNIINSLNSVSNTVWGMFILTISMMMVSKGIAEAGYYFAGVGSTLMGIKNDQTNNFNARVNNPSIATNKTEAKDA